MKNKSRFLVAGALAILCAAVTANAYVSDNFNSGVGYPPDVVRGWVSQSGVIVSNSSPITPTSAGSLYIPIFSTVSNTSPVSGVLRVWTDFYTVPRPFVSDSSSSPAIDTNATAQFFVNSNGMWVTISGDGGAGILTNVCTNVLVSSIGDYPTVTSYSVFYHVSVLHDYASSNWSLFVNDKPIATNLNFIASGVSTHEWFQVQNLGGSSNNVCWLDDFLITNKMATSGSGNTITNVVPGTTIPVADALAGFGTLQDPRKTNQTIGVSGSGVALTFGGGAGNGNYVMYGTPNVDLSSLVSNGVVSGNTFTNNSVLDGTTDRYFFKLLTVAQDGSVVFTNNETYAAFRQSRAPNTYSIMGVPVLYGDPTNGTMAGRMGTELKNGLSNGDVLTIVTNGAAYVYTMNGGGWSSTDDADGSKQWSPGVGMVLKRTALGIPTSSYFAGFKITNSVQVAITNNSWAYLAWPHNDKVFSGNGSNVLGFVATTDDYIFIQTNGTANFISARFKGTTWKRGATGAGADLALTIRPGDGIIYKTTGSPKQFISVGP